MRGTIEYLTYQQAVDFHAIYECEHCGHTFEDSGYDDDNFHRNVIPAIKCPKCDKTADPSYRPLSTKYPAWMEV